MIWAPILIPFGIPTQVFFSDTRRRSWGKAQVEKLKGAIRGADYNIYFL